MAYELKLNIEQNDFMRYVCQGRYYTLDELHQTNTFIKAELKKNMACLSGFDDEIRLSVLSSDKYKVSIVFDFKNNDVYFVTEHFNEYKSWTSMFMYGSQNTNHINLVNIDENAFLNNIEKPTKLIFLMYYKEIAVFIDSCKKQLVSTKNDSTFILSRIKQIKEEYIKQVQAENEKLAKEKQAVEEKSEEKVEQPNEK